MFPPLVIANAVFEVAPVCVEEYCNIKSPQSIWSLDIFQFLEPALVPLLLKNKNPYAPDIPLALFKLRLFKKEAAPVDVIVKQLPEALVKIILPVSALITKSVAC